MNRGWRDEERRKDEHSCRVVVGRGGNGVMLGTTDTTAAASTTIEDILDRESTQLGRLGLG